MGNEDSPEERRRRQTENARNRMGLPPLPEPAQSTTTPEQQITLAAVPREQVPPQREPQQPSNNNDKLTAKIDKIDAKLDALVKLIEDMKANPPYAMLG